MPRNAHAVCTWPRADHQKRTTPPASRVAGFVLPGGGNARGELTDWRSNDQGDVGPESTGERSGGTSLPGGVTFGRERPSWRGAYAFHRSANTGARSFQDHARRVVNVPDEIAGQCRSVRQQLGRVRPAPGRRMRCHGCGNRPGWRPCVLRLVGVPECVPPGPDLASAPAAQFGVDSTLNCRSEAPADVRPVASSAPCVQWTPGGLRSIPGPH